jgi:hypothetical protein
LRKPMLFAAMLVMIVIALTIGAQIANAGQCGAGISGWANTGTNQNSQTVLQYVNTEPEVELEKAGSFTLGSEC